MSQIRVAERPFFRSILFGRSLRHAAVRGILLGASLLALSRTVLLPVRAHGISMEPTYRSGDLLLVNALAYRWGEPRRGDVVAIRLGGGRAVLIKRIIGLPGERVRLEAGTTFVDDDPLEEAYVRQRAAWNVPETRLGPDEYYVIGDNRGMPPASHDFGRTTRARLMGRLVF